MVGLADVVEVVGLVVVAAVVVTVVASVDWGLNAASEAGRVVDSLKTVTLLQNELLFNYMIF